MELTGLYLVSQSTEVFYLRDVKQISSQVMELPIRHRFCGLCIFECRDLKAFSRIQGKVTALNKSLLSGIATPR
jgi:hypothetical protein